MLIFVVCVLIVNILLWVILLIKFKKLFSTDKIVEKTEKKVLSLTNEIDTASNRGLYLISESTKELKKTIEDADSEIQRFHEATQRLREMIANVEKVRQSANFEKNSSLIYDNIPVRKSEPSDFKNNSYKGHNAAESYKKHSEKLPESIDPDAVYEIKQAVQGDLFEEENKKLKAAQASILKDETNVLQDGSAYKEVPLIITKVLDETPVKKVDEVVGITNTIGAQAAKNKMTKNIISLYNEGFNVEQIAQQLSTSITEVQMVIDMEINS